MNQRQRKMRKRRRIHRIKIIGVFLMGGTTSGEMESYPDWLQDR